MALKEYPNIKGVLILSLSFFIMYIGYTAAGNITTKALKENGFNNLGFYSLAAVYSTFAIFSLFMSNVFKVMKAKTAMMIGTLTYGIWVFSLALTVLSFKSETFRNALSYNAICFIVISTGLLNGVGAAMLWVSQGKYLSDCAMICPHYKGFYQGIFWSLSCGSAIGAGILNAFILQRTSELTLFITAGFIQLLSILLMSLLPEPEMPLSDNLSNPTSNALKGREIINLAIDPKMMKTYGIMLSTAISLCMRQSVLIPFLSSTISGDLKQQYYLSNLAMIVQGCGMLFGGPLVGKVNDRLGGKYVAFVILMVLVGSYCLIVIYNEVHQFGVMSFFVCFMFGAFDSAVQTQNGLIMGFEFDTNVGTHIIYRFTNSMLIFAITGLIIPHVSAIDTYRYFFIGSFILLVGAQLIILLTFKFKPLASKAVQPEDDDVSDLRKQLLEPSTKTHQS